MDFGTEFTILESSKQLFFSKQGTKRLQDGDRTLTNKVKVRTVNQL